MSFAYSIGNRRYIFSSSRELPAKATPERSGDVPVGVAAECAEQRLRASHRLRADRERNCVSNIRPERLACPQSAAQSVFILDEARRRRLTGVALKGEAPRLEEAER